MPWPLTPKRRKHEELRIGLLVVGTEKMARSGYILR
jgi:hypothetical protein